MAESVFNQLIAGLDDPVFVAFFQRQCESWVEFYRNQTKQIKELETEKAKVQERIDKCERRIRCRKDHPKSALQRLLVSALSKEKPQSEGKPHDDLSLREQHALELQELIYERVYQDTTEIHELQEAINKLENNPNYLLRAICDSSGSTVIMEDLNLDTKFLITALWVRRKAGWTTLLSSDPSQLHLDGSEGCRILAMLTEIDDHLERKKIRKGKEKRKAIATYCLRTYRDMYLSAAVATADRGPRSKQDAISANGMETQIDEPNGRSNLNQEALKAVIDRGFADVLTIAAGATAVEKCNAIVNRLLDNRNDDSIFKLSQDDLIKKMREQGHRFSKKTLAATARLETEPKDRRAWSRIMQFREGARNEFLVSKETEEDFFRSQNKPF